MNKETYKGTLIQTDKKNRNGRIYPSHILMKELERYEPESILILYINYFTSTILK